VTHPKLATPRSGYGGRGYRIPGRTEVYPSVTTALNQVNKPALLQWVADQTAAKAVVSLGFLQGVADDVAWRSLRFYWSGKADVTATEVREYWKGVRDDAAELGTNIHEWIEADIDGLTDYPEADSEEMAEMIGGWLEFFRTHRVTSHRQEFTVVNDALGYAGTADADWTIECLHDPFWDDEREVWRYCLDDVSPGPYRTLVDLKSARHTWNDHGYQLAALANGEVVMREALETTEGAQRAEKTEQGKKVRSWWVEDAPPAWERYALLHIRPDDLDSGGQRIARFCVLVDLTPDMDLFMDGFIGALALAKVNKKLKDRAKARGKKTEEE
jgi:hypothetical protein